jgi:hypothetical protein
MIYYNILSTLTIDHKSLIVLLMRLGFFLIVPTIHWTFHRLMERGIHVSIHHIDTLKRLEKKFRWLADVLMLIALVAFHFLETVNEN